jgi:RNA polymerase sigma-54 factor
MAAAFAATPDLLRYARMLELGCVEFDQAVAEELADNPALTVDDAQLCARCGRPDVGDHVSECRGSVRASTGPPGARPAGQTDPPGRQSWRELVAAELRMQLAETDREAALLVVGCLDTRGFVVDDEDLLAAQCGLSRARFAGILDVLRAVGPAGIGARDVRDCLLLQLDRFDPAEPTVGLARLVIRDHLNSFAAGHDTSISRALRIKTEQVSDVRRFVRDRLHPRVPLGDSGVPVEGPLRPDIVLSENRRGGVTATVVRGLAAGLRVDRYYRCLAEQDDTGWAQRLVDRGDDFVRRVEQRSATLEQIVDMVLEREGDFVRRGAQGHVRLTRTEVATELGLHPSTVSRATAGKFVQLPSGRLIAFARFFDTALAVRDQLRVLIETEPQPLSDSELCLRLRDSGHVVARRTVAKYRAALHINARTLR